MIDYELYPHIVDNIIDYAIANALAHRRILTRPEYALRLVSRWAAERVDAALFAHIEIDHFCDCINVEGANRRPLPGFRLRGYTTTPEDEADRDLDDVPSPLRLLRYARVVDFRASIGEEDGERLFLVLRERELDVVRTLWADDEDGEEDLSACPLRCAKFVTCISWDDQYALTLDPELLAPGARSIAVTFALPPDIVVNGDTMWVEGEMEGCEEVIVRYVPKEGIFDSIETTEEAGLGVLQGFVEPMAARGGSLRLTLVGAEGLDQALFGRPGTTFKAANLQAHIIDTISAYGTRRAQLEAAVRVLTFDERRREIGEAAFELET